MDRKYSIPGGWPLGILLILGLLVVFVAGCRPAPPTSSDSPANSVATANSTEAPADAELKNAESFPTAAQASRDPAGNHLPAVAERSGSGDPVEERWYALYYGVDDQLASGFSPGPPANDSGAPEAAAKDAPENGSPLFRTASKIGHMQLRIARQLWKNRQLVRTDMLQRVSMQRYQQQVTQQIVLSSLETEEGDVLRMRSQLNDGGEDLTTEIEREENELKLTVTTLGRQESLQLPWESDWRGFFAEHQTLVRRPLQVGEVRKLQSFVPVLNVVGELRLEAGERQWIETPFGREELLRVESELTTPEIELESTLWVDEHGVVRKYVVRQGSITAYQTVKGLALAPNDDVDLYDAIQIRVDSPIPQPHDKQKAILQLRLKSGRDPGEFFSTGPSQQIRLLGPGMAELIVRAVRPTVPREVPEASSPPTAADLAANNLIQIDDPIVREMAREVRVPAGPENRAGDPWEWAVACEAYVHRSIRRKVMTEAFRTAAEVARSRQGDCTEHAVLLAALCRVEGIPARVVTGLVAVDDLYGFHMWNEVWIRDRWIPLDATLARGGIGAGHLKLSDSSLEGVSPFSALAPVLQILGDVELEVVRYE